MVLSFSRSFSFETIRYRLSRNTDVLSSSQPSPQDILIIKYYLCVQHKYNNGTVL